MRVKGINYRELINKDFGKFFIYLFCVILCHFIVHCMTSPWLSSLLSRHYSVLNNGIIYSMHFISLFIHFLWIPKVFPNEKITYVRIYLFYYTFTSSFVQRLYYFFSCFPLLEHSIICHFLILSIYYLGHSHALNNI